MKPTIAAALALTILLSIPGAPAMAQGWSYVDGAGQEVALDAVPTRIVAHANSAAALIPLGIRPVGLYADGPVAEDNSLRGLDLTGIEIIGEAWGEIDIERLAALQPDIIIAEYWPLEDAYSGMESSGGTDADLVRRIAPVAGPAQGESLVGLLEDYESLAVALGADLSAPQVAEDRAAFEAARDAFSAAVAAKPWLTTLAVSAGDDSLYVAAVEGASELSDFADWGLSIVSPEVADDRGYWETLSWENANKYAVDLVIVDDRYGTTVLDTAAAQPTWTSITAVAAGQVGDWPAFWIRNWRSYGEQLTELTALIDAAEDVTP